MTTIIAEIGLTHDGSLGNAHAMVKVAAECGADAVKFQHHIEGESKDSHPFRSRMPADKTRNDYWKRTAFTKHQWDLLIDAAHSYGIEIGITPFTLEGFNQIRDLRWDFFKIGSGECSYEELKHELINQPKPVYVSMGMMTDQVESTWSRWKHVTLMKCVSGYPSNWEQIEIDKDYGLSDHSGTPFPAFKAIAIGCPAVEVHVCYDKRQFGPDVPSSITFDELQHICDFRNFCKVVGTRPVTERQRKELHAEYEGHKNRSL